MLSRRRWLLPYLLLAPGLLWLVLFFVVRAYRKRQGLPIDAAFKEIPPE